AAVAPGNHAQRQRSATGSDFLRDRYHLSAARPSRGDRARSRQCRADAHAEGTRRGGTAVPVPDLAVVAAGVRRRAAGSASAASAARAGGPVRPAYHGSHAREPGGGGLAGELGDLASRGGWLCALLCTGQLLAWAARRLPADAAAERARGRPGLRAGRRV